LERPVLNRFCDWVQTTLGRGEIKMLNHV
jgi:hypothetical protein